MNGRIDTRPRNQWQVTAGMRGVHKDMSGKVIGGYAPDGRALGTKANMGGATPGKLASQAGTPGLDRLAAMNPKMPAPGQASISASYGNGWKQRAQMAMQRIQGMSTPVPAVLSSEANAYEQAPFGQRPATMKPTPPAPPGDKPKPVMSTLPTPPKDTRTISELQASLNESLGKVQPRQQQVKRSNPYISSSPAWKRPRAKKPTPVTPVASPSVVGREGPKGSQQPPSAWSTGISANFVGNEPKTPEKPLKQTWQEAAAAKAARNAKIEPYKETGTFQNTIFGNLKEKLINTLGREY